MNIEQIFNGNLCFDNNKHIYEDIKKRWDKVSKPLDSMGEFENIIAKIGAIQGEIVPSLEKNAVVVFASDNGVVAEGISQAGQEITAICTDAIADMKKSVSVMAKLNGIDLMVYDVGVSHTINSDNVINKKIRPGTRNFYKEKAMTYEETVKALNIGIEVGNNLKKGGYDLVCVGEMGIGNTTTSSAIIASLLNLPAEKVVGKGAGLTAEGIKHKAEVIDESIIKYNLYKESPINVLMAVGGYDIAALAGLMIGGAINNMPVVLDGYISAAAALIADSLVKGVRNFLIPSHSSAEMSSKLVMEKLGLKPVINAGMFLGEGTGAVMMVPLIKTAAEVYYKCSTFDDDGIKAYKHLK